MLKLTLVTPERKCFADLAIEEIIVPAYRGELNILAGHSPLMTTLGTGVLMYRKEASEEMIRFAISGGYCEVNPDGVLVLAETIETKDQIDYARAEASLKASREQLESGRLQPSEILKYQDKEKRALTRIALSKES